MVIESINNLYGHVDNIYLQTEDDISEYKEQLDKYNVKVFYEKWIEDLDLSLRTKIGPFARYKNTIVNKAPPGWCLSLDHDEIPTKEMARGLKQIVRDSKWGTKYDSVVFKCKGTDGNVGAGKMLLHVKIRDPWFGVSHNHFKPGLYRKEILSDFVYEHRKTEDDMLWNAIRNFYIGGGGDGGREWIEKSGLWKPLHEWCKKQNIKKWQDLQTYMLCGNVDNWLKQWMEKMYNINWHDDEPSAFLKMYKKLHGDEYNSQ